MSSSEARADWANLPSLRLADSMAGGQAALALSSPPAAAEARPTSAAVVIASLSPAGGGGGAVNAPGSGGAGGGPSGPGPMAPTAPNLPTRARRWRWHGGGRRVGGNEPVVELQPTVCPELPAPAGRADPAQLVLGHPAAAAAAVSWEAAGALAATSATWTAGVVAEVLSLNAPAGVVHAPGTRAGDGAVTLSW